jgi:thymidylate synthase
MIPDELIGNLGDVHLYNNHIEQAKEQIGRRYSYDERHEMLKDVMGNSYQTGIEELVPFGGGISEYYEIHKIPTHSRESFELPTLKILDSNVDDIAHYEIADFEIKDYQSHPSIKAPLSN